MLMILMRATNQKSSSIHSYPIFLPVSVLKHTIISEDLLVSGNMEIS